MGIIAPAGAPMPGAEVDIALLAGLVALLFMGPGQLSIDRMAGVEAIPVENPAVEAHA